MTTDLHSLADRVEAAEAGSFKLDDAAYEAIGCEGPFLEFTRSLDAAMTLVPEGFGWRLWVPNSESPEPHPFVTIWGNGRSFAPRDTIAATPALALTAASLRARASMEASRG